MLNTFKKYYFYKNKDEIELLLGTQYFYPYKYECIKWVLGREFSFFKLWVLFKLLT